MGSSLNVTNIHVDFEGENCIFLNMCTVIVRLKKKKVSPREVLSPISRKAVLFDTSQYYNSERFFMSRIKYIFSNRVQGM